MTRRNRYSFWIAPALALGLVMSAAACTKAARNEPKEPPESPPLKLEGHDITKYISLAGDQAVVVPNGTYAPGTVTTAHPETSGPYKGWLVLVAESPGDVVVDLSKDHLTLEAGTSRVLFVGFKFQ